MSPFPVAAIPFAIGGLRSIFGGKRKFKYPTIDPFNYTPNEYDPELALRRRRALEEIARSKNSTINEIARAGMLGSSTAFDILNQTELGGARQLEDISSDVFARRRSEALDLYNREMDFRRQVALANLGGDINRESQTSLFGLRGLEDIGSAIGMSNLPSFGATIPTDESLFGYLTREGGYPTEDILNAANLQFPQVQPRRVSYL